MASYKMVNKRKSAHPRKETELDQSGRKSEDGGSPEAYKKSDAEGILHYVHSGITSGLLP